MKPGRGRSSAGVLGFLSDGVRQFCLGPIPRRRALVRPFRLQVGSAQRLEDRDSLGSEACLLPWDLIQRLVAVPVPTPATDRGVRLADFRDARPRAS